MSGQPFERLIRLEDEELDGSEENSMDDKDSCKVPMMPNGMKMDSNLHVAERKLNRIANSTSRPVNFTINGRRIQMNPEQLKYFSLVTLTVQSAALNWTMRVANTQREKFSTPVAVTVAEFLKFITCIFLVWYEEVTLEGTWRTIKTNIIVNYLDTLKVAVPSFVYYVQNNLLYVGSTHLDAATTQVIYQLKILVTAVFSVLLLNKRLSKIQWFALVILFVGVAMIETLAVTNHDANLSSKDTLTSQAKTERSERPLIGFLAIVAACTLSGFAGVYFEKILKDTSHVSIWIRNIQLSVVAMPFGLLQVFIIENEHVMTKGTFYGFTGITWLCIILHVQGGLLVAVAVKYANNILKGFATSMAIVISTVASIFISDFNLTPTFILGASLVIGSVMIYNK